MEEFDKILQEIDLEQQNEGVSIPNRPLDALEKLSLRLNIESMSLSDSEAEKVCSWYKGKYGGRLSIGGSDRMAFLLNQDIWVYDFPKWCYGRCKIDPRKYVRDTSENSFNTLSISQQIYLCYLYKLGEKGFKYLQQNCRNELIQRAYKDIISCVDHLYEGDYNSARWDSLQAAEKIIKGFIRKTGKEIKRIHTLTKLVEDLPFSINQENLTKIHCTAGVRYNEQKCSKRETVEAHHAVFKLIIELDDKYKKYLRDNQKLKG